MALLLLFLIQCWMTRSPTMLLAAEAGEKL
jgi:hypothetical protein